MSRSIRCAPLPGARLARFWAEVECQLSSLGYPDGAWGEEIKPRFDDGLSVHEAALSIIEAREADAPSIDVDAEHRLTGRELGVAR